MPTLRPEFAPLPERLARLPIDARGYPVPWFVAWIDGVPDFRILDTPKWGQAVNEKRCWVCGESMGAWLAFLLGPMCTITRTISEPPSHRECAEWSAVHCPFLATPSMVRRETDLPDEPLHAAGGYGLRGNPGVIALWITRSFETFLPPVGAGAREPLVTVGVPRQVVWYREGRLATRAEVAAAVEAGLPSLLTVAQQQGRFSVEQLGRQYDAATRYWPPA